MPIIDRSTPLLDKEAITQAFEEKKKELKLQREIEEKRELLKEEIKEQSLQNQKDRVDLQTQKIQYAKTHRELLEEELYKSFEEASEKRYKATYRDLVYGAIECKKQLNIIDGVGNDVTERVIIIPSVFAERFGQKIAAQPVYEPIEATNIAEEQPPVIQGEVVKKRGRPKSLK